MQLSLEFLDVIMNIKLFDKFFVQKINFKKGWNYTIAGLIDIGPEMVKILILDFEKKWSKL